MSSTSLKSKATKGIFWNALETFSVSAGQFGLNIVLARILLPSDFGLVGMLSIFIAISQTFVDSGMGTALIQKKDRTEIDFSTVFVFNFVASLFIYFLLFFSAPFISDFYNEPQLTNLTRILSLNIIINALGVVQMNKLIIKLDFKSLAKINILSIIVSALISIPMAIYGFGVWAIVFQILSKAFVYILVLNLVNKKMPSILFSKKSFRDLFCFGSNVLGVGLIGSLITNSYNVIIGKTLPIKTLGFYTQAFQLSSFSAGILTTVLQKVTFPLLSSIQEDEKRLVTIFTKMLKMTSFIVFPLMTLIAVLASPLISLFLSEKWMPIVPLLQWLCFARLFNPISTLNMNVLNAVGRSDLYLKVDLSKIPLTIIVILISFPFGVKGIVIGQCISALVAFFFNAYLPGKLFKYGAFLQLRDMLPIMISTFGMAITVYALIYFITVPFLQILCGGMVGLISYYTWSCLLKIQEVQELNLVAKKIFKKINLNHKD